MAPVRFPGYCPDVKSLQQSETAADRLAPLLAAGQTGPGSVRPPTAPLADAAVWQAIVARYQQPSLWRSLWQIVNTLVPYGALWYLMARCLAVSRPERN